MRFRHSGNEGNGVFEARSGVIELALMLMSDSQVVPGGREFPVKAQGLLKSEPGPDLVTPVLKDDAQVKVRRSQLGRQFNRLLEALERLVEPAQRAIDRPQIALKGGARRLKRDGAADAFGRLVNSPAAKDNQPEPMPGAGLLRVPPQNLPVKLLGLFEIPGLLERLRTGQPISLAAHWSPFQSPEIERCQSR
jgi:hypothetical protein